MILDLPYQRWGAEWLACAQRVGLADEQGLGKSYQAIKACDLVGARRVAVVCPAKMRSTWEWEFADKAPSPSRRLRVMSYEEATTVFANLRDTAPLPDALILDEAHYLKNWSSGRTKAIYPVAHRIPYVWPLTATPMPNHPAEMWTHFYYLRHDWIDGMTPAQFIAAYCRTRKGFGGEPQIVGPKPDKVDELRALFERFWLRRTLAEVQPELPPMREGEIVIEATLSDEAKRLAAARQPDLFLEPDALPDDEDLARLRRLLAEAKAPVLAEFLTEELTNNPDEKIVIFAWHTAAIDILADRLSRFGAVIVDGRTAPANVQPRVNAFQADDARVRVFIGQIRAAGTGLTLTAASNVVFLECSWVPADNEQAQRRILRIGQKAASVLCRYVVLKGSIDEAVTRVLARKTRGISQIIR